MYQQSLTSNLERHIQPKKSKTRQNVEESSRETSKNSSRKCSKSASRVSFSCDEENVHGPSKFEFKRYGQASKCCKNDIQHDGELGGEQDYEEDDLDGEFQAREE